MTQTATRKGVVKGKAKPKRKSTATGRPTKFDPRYVDQARRLARLGQTDTEMAAFFGVSESTLNLWKQRHKDFSESLKEGKEEADALVADSLFHRARGYSHAAVKIFADVKTGAVEQVPYIEHYPPDTTACIFWLKNRQKAKWRDKVEQEVSGPEGGPVQLEHSGLVALDFAAVRAKRGIAPSNAG